jgi:hypothetical protein
MVLRQAWRIPTWTLCWRWPNIPAHYLFGRSSRRSTLPPFKHQLRLFRKSSSALLPPLVNFAAADDSGAFLTGTAGCYAVFWRLCFDLSEMVAAPVLSF